MPIFGKKADKAAKPEAKVEDLPEELPSLAEEIVEKADDKPAEAHRADPSIEAVEKAMPGEGIPDELPDIEPEEPAPKEPAAAPNEQPASKTAPPDTPAPLAPSDESFFKDIEERLSKTKDSTQVLKDMRLHWQKRIVKPETDMPSLIDINSRIKQKIAALTRLEQQWVSNRKQLDSLKVAIANNEAEIELRTEELSALKEEQSKMKLVQDEKRSQSTEQLPFKTTEHKTKRRGKGAGHFTFEKAFVLRDGRKVFSLQELANRVAMMSTSEFQHYTHPDNHFAKWIRDVFADQDISREVEQAETPMQLVSTLTRHL